MGLSVEKAGGRTRGLAFGITGQAGAGKTTLAATFPKPLILDLEGGTWVLEGQDVDVHRQWERPPRGRLQELKDVLRDVARRDYRTLVIDSWTRLSEWIEADILEEDGGAESLSIAFGGYGKGQAAHRARTATVIEWLGRLQERGLHVVWIMHTQLGTVDLPSGESFSHFGTEGEKRSAAKLVQSCDVVAMLRQRVQVVTAKGEKIGKVRGKGDRELLTGSVPWADVKSRFAKGEEVIPVELGVCPFADIMGGA